MSNENDAGDAPASESFQEWSDDIVLRNHDPEQIIDAFNQMDPLRHKAARGKILDHLRVFAESILTPRAGPELPEGGRRAVLETVDSMVDALLDASSKDGASYATEFHVCLHHRFIDRVRKQRAEMKRLQPPPASDAGAESFEFRTPSDDLTPEEVAMANSIATSLPEKYRKALHLYRQGYRCSSTAGEETIASMMNVSTRTAEEWLREIRRLIKIELGLSS